MVGLTHNHWASFSCSVVIITTTEEISHIDVLLGLLFLGLLLSGSSATSSGTTGSGASSGGTSADVGEQLGDVLTLEGLGEEAGPVALDGVSGGLDDLAKFFLLITTISVSL